MAAGIVSRKAASTDKLAGGVGLIMDCCGAPAHWSGRRALHDEVKAGLREKWECKVVRFLLAVQGNQISFRPVKIS